MDIERIDPDLAHELLRADDTLIYLDVRTEEEFKGGHPPGAVNIPAFVRGPVGMIPACDFLEEVRARFGPDTSIIVGCLRGGRSMAAARQLVGAGYEHIRDMRGGWDGEMGPDGKISFDGWVRRGLPVSTQ